MPLVRPWIVLLIAALPLTSSASSLPVGRWTAPLHTLPDKQLPHVPITGNGHLGIAFDSSVNTSPRNKSAAGPGATNTLDAWLNTNSFWSCTYCVGGVDPDNDVPACCSTVALGGVSIRATPTFGNDALAFSAAQDAGSGTLTAAWHTSAGGELTVTAMVHPSFDIALLNMSWQPSAGDPPSLRLGLSTWVMGRTGAKGDWNTGSPVPARAGCALSNASEVSCGSAGARLAFVSRNASTVNASVMPVSGALASGVVLGPGAALQSLAVTAAAPDGNAPWEVTAFVTLSAGSWAALLTAETESRGPGLADPVAPALALLASALLEPGAIPAAASAWWAAFWSRSSVSLPSRPAVETLWAGAQYVLATSCSSDARIAPPGLYGPWVTQDGPNWHGVREWAYACARFLRLYAVFVCLSRDLSFACDSSCDYQVT